ncbi:MAG TPA: VanZ family protein [Bacteroidales bacterium]|nr:VanZ family protein [Bacteroidales bacterium]
MIKNLLIWKLLPALVWAIMILFLTGMPGTYFPKVATFWEWLSPDKLIHIFIFGVQSFLVLTAFRVQYLLSSSRLVYTSIIVSVTILFALLTEILQVYVFIGRDGNIYDFIADVAGIMVGLLAYNLLHKKKES